ncbi:MAG TPA: integrase [Prevotellaceae bacterium]|nr:integrase [Prevotellaceae bacterium]
MSIVANTMIMNDLREKLCDLIPYTTLNLITDAVAEVLERYDVVPIITEDHTKDIMLDAFIDAMRVEGRSEKTITRYKYIIGKFLSYAGVSSRSVTQYHVRQYLASEKDRGISDGTLRGVYWVLSSYFGWLHRDGIIQRNPMSNIGRIKVQKKVREVFTDVDIEKLKSGCDNLRDKAIICFLKSTGCRISEVTQLNRDDIDFQNLECIVLGKGNKQRTVYIDPVTGMIIQEYLASRTDSNTALFVGKGAKRFLPGGVRAMLNKIANKTGVSHVHPHKFRSTEITELVNRGMPVEQVKVLAGHDKIDTTLSYVKVDQANIKNAYKRYA